MKFVVSKGKIAEALQKDLKAEDEIGMSGLIELFTRVLSEDADMVSEETLQNFLCRETKSYCDMDISVRESSRMISIAKESTGTILEAARANDMERVQSACDELDSVHKKLEQIEQELYLDEETKLFNRRYIFGKKLEDGKSFNEKGVLIVIKIDDFPSIVQEYGQHTSGSVLKYFAKQLSTLLPLPQYETVYFTAAVFVLMISEEQQMVAERKIEGFRASLMNHKFKTSDQKMIRFGFNYGLYPYKGGDFFLPVFKQTMETIGAGD